MNDLVITKVEERTGAQGTFFTVTDDQGKQFSCFEMKFRPKFIEGQTLDVNSIGLRIEERVSKGKHYLNLVEVDERFNPRSSQRTEKMERVMEQKATNIDKAIDKKSSNISMAQDRNERMWAKFGACEIVANHPAYKNYKVNEIEPVVDHLANFILSMNLDGEHVEHKSVSE